jgi:flagellin-like hook-associated protein FlgL
VNNTAIFITDKDPTNNLSGVQVVLDNTTNGVTYDGVNKVLTVGIDPNGNTTANDVVKMINGSDYGSTFYTALDPAGGNDGTGKVVNGTTAIIYGAKLTSIDPLDPLHVTPVPNTGVVVSSVNPSDNLSGVQVVLDAAATGVTYDDVNKVLTVGIVPGATTANNVVTAINTSPFASMFQAVLDPVGLNDGSGFVEDGTSTTITASNTLVGSDVNQKETEGIYTALIRLKNALSSNNDLEIQRSMALLDSSTQNMNFSRAELGTRQQGLDVMTQRLSNENIELNKVLSNDYDADLTTVVSQLAGQQAAIQASLRATASILQVTLLNYL